MREYSEGKVLAELWRRGDVKELLLHEGQLKIREMIDRMAGQVIVLNISRQWGKTYGLVEYFVEFCIKNPRARTRIGAAFESDLTEFIEPAFEAVLQTCPPSLRPRYIAHKKRYIFKNGSTIKLVGLDKRPNGLRGNTIDLIGLDEAGFIRRLGYLYDSVIIPLTTHRPNARIIMQSTPPESPDHEFWDFVERAKLIGSYAEFTIDENPLLGPDDVKRLEDRLGGRHTTAFRREYLCERIIEEERAIVPEWGKKFVYSHDFHDDPKYQFWHKYQALDIGVQRDKTLDLFGFYNFQERRLYIEHDLDISGTKATTDLIEAEITKKEREVGYENTYRRIADNSHPLLLNDLSARGIHFAATDKAKLHEMVGELRVWVRMDRLRVHERCKQLLGCLFGGIWNEKKTEFERSKVFGHYDALAALIYLVRNIDQHTNPVPDWFINPDKWPIHNKTPGLSPLGQDMKALFSRRPSARD